MRLISANIKSNPLMKQEHVVADLLKVHAVAGVVLWQELEPQRYKDALRSNFNRGWEHTHLETEIPISYQADIWQVVPELSGKALMHPGRKLVTPERFVVWTGLRRKHSRLDPIIVMNTHMISGAFSNHYPLTKNWRRKQWEAHFAHQQGLVKDLIMGGHTVLGGGDTNRGTPSMPKYAPSQVWLGEHGIDHLWCVEAPNSVKVSPRSHSLLTGMYTDHNPVVATLALTGSALPSTLTEPGR